MKTVPTVRLADMTDAATLPDLPEEIRLAMTDIAGAARDGLMAMSVAAGLAVMQAMFEAEIAGVAGPKGKHDPGRAALRHGQGRGSVTLGGRRVAVDRPRARTVDGHEVPLTSYTQFASDDLLSQVVMERMLAGVATRRHARTGEPVGTQVVEQAKSTSRSAISRRFVRQTETALGELMARDLSGEDIKVLMLDGEHMAERCVVVALAITADGTKKPVGLWDGSTENKTVVRALLADLVARGLAFDDGLLVVLDGAKALSAAVREVFGDKALIQRCTLHKRRNVADHLPDKDKAWVDAKLVKAFGHADPDTGLRNAASTLSWVSRTTFQNAPARVVSMVSSHAAHSPSSMMIRSTSALVRPDIFAMSLSGLGLSATSTSRAFSQRFGSAPCTYSPSARSRTPRRRQPHFSTQSRGVVSFRASSVAATSGLVRQVRTRAICSIRTLRHPIARSSSSSHSHTAERSAEEHSAKASATSC